MRAFCCLERSSRKRGTAARIAFALLVVCTPMARAQSDIDFGRPDAAGAGLSVSRFAADMSHLSLRSWSRNLVGTVVGWIIRAVEDTPPPFIPEDVVLHAIPGHGSYRYAVIGGQRLVVDATTRAVIYVVD